jgi:hypothetical protein
MLLNNTREVLSGIQSQPLFSDLPWCQSTISVPLRYAVPGRAHGSFFAFCISNCSHVARWLCVLTELVSIRRSNTINTMHT